MTTLGSPGLSSQSVLGFSGRKGPKNLETDWDDNPGKPRLVIPVRFGDFWPKKTENPKTDWDDNPGKPNLVIPVHLGFFGPKRVKKHPKRTGMTTLGSPSLSSQFVSGFFGRKEPTNPETDWDDNPGKKPRLVIAVRFGVFWPKRAKKPRNELG